MEPPGESIRIAAAGTAVAEDVLPCESPLPVRERCVSDGMFSLSGELGAISGTIDEADERVERILVLEVRIDGSELPEDKAGDSRATSGDPIGAGDVVNSAIR